VNRLCTVRVITRVELPPDKVQRDADFRFSKVQFNYECILTFYDRCLQEVCIWIETGNAFDAEVLWKEMMSR